MQLSGGVCRPGTIRIGYTDFQSAGIYRNPNNPCTHTNVGITLLLKFNASDIRNVIAKEETVSVINFGNGNFAICTGYLCITFTVRNGSSIGTYKKISICRMRALKK